MSWWLLAICSGILLAMRNLNQRELMDVMPAQAVGLWYRLLVLPPLAVLALVFEGPPLALPSTLWGLLALAVGINVLGTLCALRGLSRATLGQGALVFAATPLLQAALGPLLFAEILSPTGVAGLLLGTAGAALLARRLSREALWPLLMATVLSAGGGLLDKMAVLAYGQPIWWMAWQGAGLAAGLWLVLRLYTGAAPTLPLGAGTWRPTLASTGLGAAALATYATAVGMAPVAYVVSLRRMEVVASLLLGRWRRAEPFSVQAWLCCGLLLAGGILTALGR